MPQITPEGVDATAVSAVASRIREVTAQEGRVVSVPPLTIGYHADALRFAEGAEMSREQATAAAEFSELVNRVPVTGPVWSWEGVDHLWDVYFDVLGADLAVHTRTADEDRRYREAQRILHEEVGGASVPSETYLAYQSCRHAVLTARTALAQARGSAKERALKEAVEAAEQEWLVKGGRQVVEAALHDLSRLGDKDPAQTWAAYRAQFDPSPDSLHWATGLDGSRYAVTGFAPSAMFDQPWPELRIDRSALPTTTADIDSLSFEYALVNVVRPWLDPAMLRSRAWRFPTGETPLSDGADPPVGRCTSYVESVVLARSLRVVCGPHAHGGPAHGAEAVGLGFLEPEAATLVASEQAVEGLVDAPPEFVPTEETERVMGHYVFPGSVDPAPQPAVEDPAAAGLTVRTTPADTVLLVAFLLRLLPKCPDPDPALRWGEPEPPRPRLKSVALANVRYGAKNADVRVVQRALIGRGRTIKAGATGFFGAATKAAYAAEQRAQGYQGKDADGVPGCLSLTALGEASGFTVKC
ncbi:hypothetical protein ABT001_29945 [Streptomyces sp. NPDC002793]|uniref:hypothetical protein n=1 Tax=Streptomyces sp. NPDC002793 TaxID=3154432 RepID=UPI0033187A58